MRILMLNYEFPPLGGMARVLRELKPFSFLQAGEAMLFVLALFVIYNRAKLYSADAYGVRMRDLRLLPLSFCMPARTSFCSCILRTRDLRES